TQNLSTNLTAIRAVLRDAEKKQITSEVLKNWLHKLTDAAYVLDDILDECSIHSTKVHSDDGHTSCLSPLHPKDILFRFNIGKRMKHITQRFQDIHQEKSRFHLELGVTEVQTVDDDWRQTSSDITEPTLYGRDQDREQIVKFLLEDASNSEDLSVYPIVGMGGLGKTTLAKLVFNDHRVCNHFDLTIWVCVSDDFNSKTILQSIIECCTGQNPNLNTLEAVRKKVEEVLQSKRYLLVLDDVWNEDKEKWKQLKGKLHCARAAKGATILVTTRLQEVASTMETHSAYHLTGLSGDDSWSLFKHHAFGQNREEIEELVAIGREIVRRCVGSPLAIKTLGSLLRDKSEVSQWENVKENEIWNIREESSSMTREENSIIRTLKLSYSNLELSLRRCFSFCAIFPKDFEIDKEDLIHLWMANGFIKSEGNVEVEDVGNKKLQNMSQLRMPKELTILQDLRHIVIDNCGVNEMPQNIGKLRHLRTLSTYVVGSKAGCGLAELHSLKLGGKLRIKGLENVPNEWDAKQANLIVLANSKGSNVNVERVLEALQPPSTLKSFMMRRYKGRQLSNWMRNDAVLRDLVEVTLWGCDNCEELPPLGKLPHLKRLYVLGIKNVKCIDGERYDGVEEKAFPTLEYLWVKNLPKLERMLREEGVEMLPCLSELTIYDVSNLKFPPASLMEGVVENMPCLKILEIEGVVVLPDQLSGLGALQKLRIEHWYNLGLRSLKSLSISNCENLKSLSEGVRYLTCLEILSISSCQVI
ncbi:hypothetical protein PHAVU_002G130400, partial [Phaseolus vulgaris]